MMKKVVLSLAGVMAAAAFAPEASALPLFARQTGMACNACHFNHFPMLNAFGRSFKSSGFTLMGAQGKVEGEGLSIPSTLNMALLTTAGYTKTNANNAAQLPGTGTNNNGNGFFVPGTNGELSLFMGGRVSEFAGFLTEIGLVGNTGSAPFASTVGLHSAKLPMFWDVASYKAGLVLFTTDGAGASYGFETLNTGANAVHTMLFVAGDNNGSIGSTLSAQQYIGTGTSATGAALVANSDMGFVNITKFHMVGPADLRGAGTNGTNISSSLGSNYVRVAGTFDMAGWDTGVGIQNWSGASINLQTAGATAGAYYDTHATAIDGQMQGSLGGMPVGFYASYARAPSVAASGGVTGNIFNGGPNTKSSFNISGEVGVIPEKATLDAGIRRANSGAAAAVGGGNLSDNSWLIGGTYKLAQNMVVQLDFTHATGDYYSDTATAAAAALLGTNQTTVTLSSIF